MKPLINLIPGLFLIALFGCNSGKEASKAENRGIWDNPVVKCKIDEDETPELLKPAVNEGKISREHFGKLCAQAQGHFQQSGYNYEKADKLYEFMAQKAIITDQNYGMPSPELKAPEPLNKQQLKKRVAIKYLNDNTFEAFFYFTSCGRQYRWYRIKYNENEIVETKEIQAWAASYPC